MAQETTTTTSGWRAGALSGHADYEIHDELYTADGRCVAVLECFTTNPTIYYCNALTPEGEAKRIGACRDFQRAKDWAEGVAGLRAARPQDYRRE